MQFIMQFVKSGKQQQGNLLVPSELESISYIDDTQVSLNDEIQSNHEQGFSEVLTNEETSNNHKKISHGVKKLRVNNKDMKIFYFIILFIINKYIIYIIYNI